jgi:hypothetical protein
LLQSRTQARKLVARSLRKNFHAAVGIVAHPPSDSENVSFPLHKPAEAYPLHTSPHNEPASFNWLFCGSHRLKNIIVIDAQSKYPCNSIP